MSNTWEKFMVDVLFTALFVGDAPVWQGRE